MDHTEELNTLRMALFVPVELQRRGFMNEKIFSELADRALLRLSDGVQQVQPWCRWQGLSQYLDCVAYADRSAKELSTGRNLTLEHVTPGRFYSVSIIFLTQALIDTLAVWLCDALSLPVAGGERHFLSRRFKRELQRKEPDAAEQLDRHATFIEEVNKYRQVWIHTISGGVIPIADDNPFENPESDRKFLGVPINPAIQPDQENYVKNAEQIKGPYLYELAAFTGRIFDGATAFYMGWLRFALDHV